MKKFFSIMLMLITTISIAMAQPAMINKGTVNGSVQINNLPTMSNFDDRDPLQVEIVTNTGYHYPNDSSLICPLEWMDFYTNGNFAWYQWETSLSPDDYYISEDQAEFNGNIIQSCYIKVTVGDNLGNTGSDSIYFNVKNWLTLPDQFEMEIIERNDVLNAKLTFKVNADNYYIRSWMTYDNVDWIYNFEGMLNEGMNFHHIYNGFNYSYDTVWNLRVGIYDSCGVAYYDEIPGMYLGIETDGNNNHFLNIKTNLQSKDDEYVYLLFTIDANGDRHPFTINGQQVILPYGTESYQIPSSHTDDYYQCAIAKSLNDTELRILSYSNKVTNPWITDIFEYNESNFSIYPNPSQGHASIIGNGTIKVTNYIGQTVMTEKIDGETTITLPHGIWFVEFYPNTDSSYTKGNNLILGNKKLIRKLIIQ